MTIQESPINNDSFAYIVGMDFGTTFSGAGYIFIKNNGEGKEIIDIKKWPKNQASQYTKVPTVIRYHLKDPKLYKCGSEALLLQPQKAREYGKIIRLFKLHLDEESTGIPELPEGMTVLQVISDYLRDFFKNICNEMQGALGARDFEKKRSTFRYCLTVPAMWTDRAKTIMREAAIQAGIIDTDDHPDRLILIGEPESAALYSEKMRGGITIKSGETLMICDAGGGTVDLTTFQKTIDGESKSFKEITEGYGNSSGSAQLDLNFRNYILRMTRNYSVPTTEKALDELVDHFQKQVKRGFGDERSVGDMDEADVAIFQLPYELHGHKMEIGGFKMDGELLEIETKIVEREIFDPVVEEILLMIEFQLSQLLEKLDYIILVGGFGQSKYLLKKIREKFESKVGSIIVPDAGELAVARGAVYFGLDPYSISHRRMRLSYGVSISSPFVQGVDKEEYKVKDKKGDYFCKNRFDVFVRKGQDVSLSDCVTREYFTFNSNTCHIKLFGYHGDKPPRYCVDEKDSKQGVQNAGEDKAFKVADFIMELPLQRESEGEKTAFNLYMYFGHMEIKIEVDIPGTDEKLVFKASYEKDGNQNIRRSKGLPAKFQQEMNSLRARVAS